MFSVGWGRRDLETVVTGADPPQPTFPPLLGQDAACACRGALGHVDDVLAFHLRRHPSPLHRRQARLPLVGGLGHDWGRGGAESERQKFVHLCVTQILL